MSEPKDGHLEDVLGGEKLPKHSQLPQRKIKPWHKPRKQWIRRHQWLKKIADLCGKLNLKDERPLRYLSLPGEDLLDIRVIRECCSERGIKLKYLGLNDEHSSADFNTWLHVAWNEVNSLAAIHHDSVVVKDRFERIADPKSLAAKYVKEYGPFDVVNLDLCESISPITLREPNYYDALKSLAEHQIKTRAASDPWLLLLTSKVGGPWVTDTDMRKLAACIAANAEDHHDFGLKLNNLVPLGVDLAKNTRTNWKKVEQPHFLNLFGVGFGKWLLQLLASASPKWSVTLLCSYSYRVHARSPDMVSLAFLIESHPEGLRDRFGLTKGASSPASSYSEKHFAMELVDGVRSIKDLDESLKNDSATYLAMEKETYDLLVSARYQPGIIQAGLAKFSARKGG